MEKKCKYCKQPINVKASICYHCQSKQSLWGKFPKLLEATSLVISLALLVLSFSQYQDSKKEKKDSAKALEISNQNMQKSQQALAISNELKSKTESLYKLTDSISTQIKNISLLSIKNEFLLANNSFMAMNTSSHSARELEKNINSLLLLILGRQESVDKWGKSNLDIKR